MSSFSTPASVNGSTPIPSWLQDSPDPSLHVAEFLNDPYYQRFGGWDTNTTLNSEPGHVLNWTAECSDPAKVFSNYGSFIGCLLYPNVTQHVANHTLPSNLSDVGYGWNQDATPEVNSQLWTDYTTCLVTMCSSQPDCLATYDCTTRNMLTDDNRLSGAGVSTCWRSICSGDVLASTVDPDIAGVGILVSYLIQTVIALMGLCGLSTLAFLVWYRKRRGHNTPSEGSIQQGRFWKRSLRDHWAIGSSVLSEFHKAQCYFAIALQIAAFILLKSQERQITFTSINLLLLVGLDGVIPVVATLYTLMTFGDKAWYTFILSLASIVMSSFTGLYVSTRLLGFGSGAIQTGGTGQYSPTCGNNGPEAICLGFPDEVGDNGGAAASTTGIIILMDIITAALLIWMVADDETTHLGGKFRSLLRRRRAGYDTAKSDSTTKSTVKHALVVAFHTITSLAIIGCILLEFFWFHEVFIGSWVDFKDWSFGQIVGLMTWSGVFVEWAYLEYFGLEDGLEWRFPAWLKVTSPSKESRNDDEAAEPKALPKQHQKTTSSDSVHAPEHKAVNKKTVYLELHDQSGS